MIVEVALITISCVLFVQMGLCGAIEELLHIRLPIVSCPKCCTFWMCIIHGVAHEQGMIVVIATSFIASYAALWLVLVYDSLARLYNYLYETITPQTKSASKVAKRANSHSKL